MIRAIWRWLGASHMVSALLVGLGTGCYTAWHMQELRYEAQLARVQTNALHAHQVHDQIANHTENTTHAHLTAIEHQARTLTSQIPRYLTAQDAMDSAVPIGFVHLYNTAFTALTSTAPTRTDDQSTGISFTELADASIFNASICRQWQEQTLAWRAFYQQLRHTESVGHSH